MKPAPSLWRVACLLALSGLSSRAQVVTYDFNNGPQHGSLPLSFTVDGLTATFSASPAYYGYSVQLPSDAAGVTPSGFTGLCLAPNTVYQSDLVIAFDQPLSSISLMYAPDELATDSSCTMRIMGYSSGNVVGTSSTTAQPGTWPTGTLALSSAQAFDSVVVHYDQAPPTGGDYGRIFMVECACYLRARTGQYSGRDPAGRRRRWSVVSKPNNLDLDGPKPRSIGRTRPLHFEGALSAGWCTAI